VGQAPPQIKAVVEALQALRGVAQTTAATIVSDSSEKIVGGFGFGQFAK
jgi:hypothetical protein